MKKFVSLFLILCLCMGSSISAFAAESDSSVSPRSMPVTRTLYEDFEVNEYFLGKADMRVEVNVTVNVQNGDVMSINSVKVYQYGTYYNFLDWQTVSVERYMNNPNRGWIKLIIRGNITFEYTNPITGSTYGQTEPVLRTIYIDCN